MFVCVVLLTFAFPASAGRVGGSEGDVRGSFEFGRNRTAVLPSFRSPPFSSSGGNDSRIVLEKWFLQEIKNYILNRTRGKNGSLQAGPTMEEPVQNSPDQMNLDDKRDLVRSTVPPYGAEWIQRTSINNTRNSRVEAIKFPADEVSKDNNDVLVQFALHNYTDMQVDEAELLVFLRYRQPPANQSAVSRKPEVRRIAISVYRDTGNAKSSGNASSVDRSSMTTSLFQIRRTKWVKVLLMRSWIEEAISSPSRNLRLRLVYNKSGSIEVVMTARKRSERAHRKTNRKRMRIGTVGTRSRRPTELAGNRKRKMSPVLVVMKREKLPTFW